ncbi:MAG: YraN family protein [Flavobacterium sp.]
MAEHNDIGKLGEEIAANYLDQQGYEILERNWKFEKAEVDILAQKDDFLVAVEVKTRTTDAFGLPQEFLKPAQIKRLVKAVDEYMQQHKITNEVRFDVIAVIIHKKDHTLEHIIDAFYYF